MKLYFANVNVPWDEVLHFVCASAEDIVSARFKMKEHIEYASYRTHKEYEQLRKALANAEIVEKDGVIEFSEYTGY